MHEISSSFLTACSFSPVHKRSSDYDSGLGLERSTLAMQALQRTFYVSILAATADRGTLNTFASLVPSGYTRIEFPYWYQLNGNMDVVGRSTDWVCACKYCSEGTMP